MGKKYVRVSEVAERLGVSQAAVNNWINDGSLPAVRMAKGKMWRVPEEDLNRLLKASVPQKVAVDS